MSKHTPGPWKIIRHEDAPNVCWVGSANAESIGDGFATVWAIGKQNARLIAAAPELLEALKTMLGEFNEHMAGVVHDELAAIAKARAAIAKATGEK